MFSNSAIKDPAKDIHFQPFVHHLAAAIGGVTRQQPLEDYLRCRLIAGTRVSMELMADLTRHRRQSRNAQFQKLHNFVDKLDWHSDQMLEAVLGWSEVKAEERKSCWVINEVLIPRATPKPPPEEEEKKTQKIAVGVRLRRCPPFENNVPCQSAVFISLATSDWAFPLRIRLKLNRARRGEAENSKLLRKLSPEAFLPHDELAVELLIGLKKQWQLTKDLFIAPEFPNRERLASRLRKLRPTLQVHAKPPAAIRQAALRAEAAITEIGRLRGLDGFDGRSWHGFHHHWALCVAAYAWRQRRKG